MICRSFGVRVGKTLERGVVGLGLIALLGQALPAATYDVLIRGGRVLDGSGTPWRLADLGITGDRIVALGPISADATANETINAHGLYVAPGFIDPHSHAGGPLAQPELKGGVPLLMQGLTTIFANPDGGGPTDLAAQRRTLEANGIGLNVAQYIGHNSIRAEVLGYENRAPTETELTKMKALVRRGMEAGAFGLSAGPFYVPGSYTKTDEHIALAQVAAEFHGVYTSHIRDESNYSIGVVAAVDEVIAIARAARLPGIVTHIKVSAPAVWGASAEMIKHVEAARSSGVEIWADQYPYEASSTSLGALLLPSWSQEGGSGALKARLEDPTTRARIRETMVENIARRGGPGTFQISQFSPEPALAGKRLDAIARQRDVEPVDAAIDLIHAGNPSIVSFSMHENDIRAFMQQPWVMTCSDGGLVAPGVGVPHPRGNGTFPRKIHRYVVEERLMTLEQAVHSMTGRPAAVMQLRDRGALRVGAYADVVVFDFATIRDRATYENPHQLSEGVRYLLVNGRTAIEDGRITGTNAGRVVSLLAP